jgi:hypothetical protein
MTGVGIREVLMAVYAVAWLVVVVLTAWRTGEVPAELWAGLGIGEGALMAIFRGDEALRRRGHAEEDE